MKKTILLLLALVVCCAVQAQWGNNANTNTFIANTSSDAGEIYLSTDEVSGDTYVQWNQFGTNGWSPSLQRLNYQGNPQWGDDGIHIAGHEFSSSSEGVSMAATNDGGVVSCFAAYDGYSYAVRINADGTFPWGEQGVQLFDGLGFSRTETIAGNDGGVWALGCNYSSLFLQYVNADGTLNPLVTISDNTGFSCMFGQMTLSNDNRVFVTYEKLGSGSGLYKEKQIHVAGYAPDGTQFSPETLLMSSQTFQSTYIHSAVPDGQGGGYVYIWHPALGGAFNTYVFHFNQNGAPTILDTNGIPVHTPNSGFEYLDAYATVDPTSHDLLIAFEETDSDTQTLCRLYVNRITQNGDKPWNDGFLALDNGTIPAGGLRIDAFEYEPGFSLIYHKGVGSTGYQSIVEAQGFDLSGNNIWTTTMCSSAYSKTGDQNSTGFHQGQNIVAWVNSNTGGLYGQNIGVNGAMGLITPPTPPEPCSAPSNFDGKYVWEPGTMGVNLFWTAAEELPLYYHLYRRDLATQEEHRFEVDANATEYFDEVGIGDYMYWITAIHEECVSEPAITVGGETYILVEVTSVDEDVDEEIVTVTKIYTMNGQLIRNARLEDLSHGIYILQGLTSSGKLVNRKIKVD